MPQSPLHFDGLVRLKSAMVSYQYAAAIEEVTKLADLTRTYNIYDLPPLLLAALNDLARNEGYEKRDDAVKMQLFLTTYRFAQSVHDMELKVGACDSLIEQLPGILTQHPVLALEAIGLVGNTFTGPKLYKILPLYLECAEAAHKTNVSDAIDADLFVITSLPETDPLSAKATAAWEQHFNYFTKTNRTRPALYHANEAATKAARGSAFQLRMIDLVLDRVEKISFVSDEHPWIDCLAVAKVAFGPDKLRYQRAKEALDEQLSLAVERNPARGLRSRLEAYNKAQSDDAPLDLINFTAEGWINDVNRLSLVDYGFVIDLHLDAADRVTYDSIMAEKIGQNFPSLISRISETYGDKAAFGIASSALERISPAKRHYEGSLWASPLHKEIVTFLLDHVDTAHDYTIEQRHASICLAAQFDGSSEETLENKLVLKELDLSLLTTETPDEKFRSALNYMHTYRYKIGTRAAAAKVALAFADAAVAKDKSLIRVLADALRSTEGLPELVSKLQKKCDGYQALLPRTTPSGEEITDFMDWIKGRRTDTRISPIG